MTRNSRWVLHEKSIGKSYQSFKIVLEVQPVGMHRNSLVAFDNIRLVGCFPELTTVDCSAHQYRCHSSNECINNNQVCDINKDCRFGDDEYQNCGEL